MIYFHRIVFHLNLRPDKAFWLYLLLVLVFFGFCGYTLVDVTFDLSTFFWINPGRDPGFCEPWWWNWIRFGAAGITGVGMMGLAMYGSAGSWESAKQDFVADCDKASKKKESEQEVQMHPLQLYSWSFLYARAVGDCALWAKEMFEHGKIDPYMPLPLWHSLGPFVIVGTIALSRSAWARGKTDRLCTRVRPAEDEKTAPKKDQSMV